MVLGQRMKKLSSVKWCVMFLAHPCVDGKGNFYLSEMLDNIFVPAHIAPFFFFDGEEVKRLADQGRIEQVKQGLEGLLGVVLLRNLSDRLRSFEHNERSGITTVDEEKLNRLHNILIENAQSLKGLKDIAAAIEEDRSQLRGEHNILMERITAAGGGGGDIATVKELVEERGS